MSVAVTPTADRSPYRGYCFRHEIIAHAVWLYFRFQLSLATCRISSPSAASSSATNRSASGAPSSVQLSRQGCIDDEDEPATSGIWTKCC